MTKTIWRVETPGTIQEFDNLKDAKKLLREDTEGNIYKISGMHKVLAYFLPHSSKKSRRTQ